MDNEYNTVVTCFATCWGDSIKDKYEAFYVKLTEVTNVLLIKAKRKRINPGEWKLYVGCNLAALYECSSTGCRMRNDTAKERVRLGTLDARWKIWQDNNLQPNEAVVECDYGKAQLVVENLEL